MSSRQTRTLILILFLLSGSAGLVYEIVWMKMLTLIIGSTIFATTTVLTSFMGGLALGSFLAGRIVDRRTDHLKIYGILEGAIGAYALALPMLLGWTEPLFRFIYQNFHTSFYTFGLLRFLVCGLVLLIPTTLMGATLPVLSKYFVERQSQLGWTIGKLYGVNTFGAVAGALAAGFVFIPALGVSRTIYSAALLNLAIAAVVLVLSRRAAATAPEQRGEQLEKELNSEKERRSKKERERRKERRSRKERERRKAREIEKEPVGAASLDNRTMVTVMLVMGLSGVAAMIYQIAWTRVLSLSIGSSVYAFSLIVGAFICGLALGSVAIARLVDRRENLVLTLAMVQVGIGVSALLLVPILGNLPTFVAGNVLRLFQSFADVHLAEFAVIFLLMLLPTVLMGGAFPIAIKICAPDLDRLGKLVGNVYAVNTLGAIIGSFGAGFLLIPWLGTENTIVVAAAINMVAAGLIVAQSTVLVPRTRVALVAGAMVIVSLAGWRMPRWDEFILTSGSYLYADLYRDLATEKDFGVDAAMREGYELLYFREGLSAVVSVKKTADGDIALEINGKTDATAKGDAATQLMLGHLPLLLHEDAKDVLVIGLGSGMTLGAVARRPVERIDVVELEEAVVEASEYFRPFNGDALSDPRVEVVVADGRTHLAFADDQYDVIISEPSNVWVSGMASLFTREFFASAMGRLRAGGIMCQWVHAYTMSPEDFKTIVNTFSSVFPHTMMWEADFGNDYLLIGHVDDLSVDYATLEQRLSDERIRDDLLRMNVANVASFVGKLIMVDEAIAEYAGGAPLHTDDNFLLEYSAPKAVLKDRSSILVSDLYRHRSDLSQALQALGWSEDEATGDGLARVLEAKRELAAGYVDFLEGSQQDAIDHLERALSLHPGDYDAAYVLATLYYDLGNAHEDAGSPERAADAYALSIRTVGDVVAREPASLHVHFDLAVVHARANLRAGMLFLRENALEAAAQALQKSLAGQVRYAETYNNLGVVYEREGRYDEAREEYEAALEVRPRYVPGRMNLGNLFLREGRYEEATESYRQVLEERPDYPMAYYNLGAAYFNQGDLERAETEWMRALELNPEFTEARSSLEVVRSRMSGQ